MLAGAAAVGLALTGCGQGSPSGSTASPDEAVAGELTKVVVGVLPIAPVSAIQYGVDKGIFEKNGLDIEFQTASSGGAMLPAVSTNSINIGIGNPLAVFVAVDKGLDMKFVSGFSNAKAEGNDVTAVIVKKDSGINSWKDLEGKSVSVNAVNSMGDLTIKEAVARDGGDPKAVKFAEVAFPDAPAQLERGNIDAAWVTEPFVAKALADTNNKLLGYNYQELIPGLPTMVAFTSGKYAADNPEAIAAFKTALGESMDAVKSDDAGVRKSLAEYLKIPQPAADSLNMEEFSAGIRTDQLKEFGTLMTKYEYVAKEPDLDAILIK
jgi:NitT/TauT family transport system substrate-binding protein